MRQNCIQIFISGTFGKIAENDKKQWHNLTDLLNIAYTYAFLSTVDIIEVCRKTLMKSNVNMLQLINNFIFQTNSYIKTNKYKNTKI